MVRLKVVIGYRTFLGYLQCSNHQPDSYTLPVVSKTLLPKRWGCRRRCGSCIIYTLFINKRIIF